MPRVVVCAKCAMDRPRFRAYFLHPRFWLLRRGLALLWLIVQLPCRVSLVLGLRWVRRCAGFPAASEEAGSLLINRWVERAIAGCSEQYLVSHRRNKMRPGSHGSRSPEGWLAALPPSMWGTRLAALAGSLTPMDRKPGRVL